MQFLCFISGKHRELGNPYELVPKEYRPSFRQPDAVRMIFFSRFFIYFILCFIHADFFKDFSYSNILAML